MSSTGSARWPAAILVFLAACSGNSTSPTPPPPPPPTQHPTVAVASMQVTGDSLATGYRYRTTLKLRESTGVAATIASVDLTFVNGTATVATSHHEKPLSDSANVCPASGTVETRELETTDAAHPYATAVRATVTFTDAASFTGTATGSADVPPLAPVQQTYSITGVITDASTHAAIAGARVEALNGANAGKAATTDGSGTYVINELVAETFRMRASANGYSTGEQNVTIPINSRADFELQPIVQTPCAYNVTSNAPAIVSWEGGQFTVTITRTSGTCGWTASAKADWISFPQGTSGSGTATLTFAVSGSGLNSRSSTITVSWTGGGSDVAVAQGPHPDWTCNPFAMSKGPQDFDNVPAAGGTLTVNASATANPPEWSSMCAVFVSSTASWISGGGTVIGPTALTFTAAPNPSPGTARTGAIVGGSISISVTQR